MDNVKICKGGCLQAIAEVAVNQFGYPKPDTHAALFVMKASWRGGESFNLLKMPFDAENIEAFNVEEPIAAIGRDGVITQVCDDDYLFEPLHEDLPLGLVSLMYVREDALVGQVDCVFNQSGCIEEANGYFSSGCDLARTFWRVVDESADHLGWPNLMEDHGGIEDITRVAYLRYLSDAFMLARELRQKSDIGACRVEYMTLSRELFVPDPTTRILHHQVQDPSSLPWRVAQRFEWGCV